MGLKNPAKKSLRRRERRLCLARVKRGTGGGRRRRSRRGRRLTQTHPGKHLLEELLLLINTAT
ncbi:hypothetical protein A6R68_13936 [Neotoma lepida]|uniref:Uncharacterized protein n=1 Tax=Neotoma lepida TaxID=56216 RepID=A0A1A6H1J2_NEOLE|nr:hypothetical protein A6R68_13936 [Neotoma lepida]